MSVQTENDRDLTIRSIRASLKKRSGRTWSVTGGTGTAWGWIRIDAPPARRTWRHEAGSERTGTGEPIYHEVDTGKPDSGHMSPADRAQLAELLGLESVHCQGVSIPASSAYRREYIDRANGHEPKVIGSPYWD